ncbi:hypothetical protein [Amycolatopsis sp. NPDC003731]
MDEDYARKLRDWLRAEPGPTPRGASEEREWLREIPEPATEEQAERWTVRGHLPQTPADDDWVCPVIALPVPRPSRENGCRLSGIELHWTPPRRISDAEASSRWNHPTNADRRADASRISDAEARSRWSHPTNADRRAEVSRTSDAEARSRWSHPTNADRRTEALEATPNSEADTNQRAPMTDAEARSRWNHPSSWHRRRRAAEDRRDQPGGH